MKRFFIFVFYGYKRILPCLFSMIILILTIQEGRCQVDLLREKKLITCHVGDFGLDIWYLTRL